MVPSGCLFHRFDESGRSPPPGSNGAHHNAHLIFRIIGRAQPKRYHSEEKEKAKNFAGIDLALFSGEKTLYVVSLLINPPYMQLL